ncbi:MAG: carboxypeptidase-like regulatory domain-containing protein, partial [Mariniphaga sp.]|nr:carboxypeptidase-like regulatory domain-containing protein [Mariniphaga sp.]
MKKGLKLKILLLFLAIMLQGAAIYGQQTVTGSVTDASSGEALVGATVVIKGTSIGTVTDVDGNFSIQVPGLQEDLLISFVGFENQEIPIGGRTVIHVQLQESDVLLSEMV